jgi:hypothetical protein
LFFGAPNPLLVLEDLAYSLDLAELKLVFADLMKEYHEEAIINEHMACASEPLDIH